MTPRELKALLKVCQDHGVSRLRLEGFEVELEQYQAPLKAVIAPTSEVVAEEPATHITPSDEELIYWSSGPVPE